jgi:hypothetical protein
MSTAGEGAVARSLFMQRVLAALNAQTGLSAGLESTSGIRVQERPDYAYIAKAFAKQSPLVRGRGTIYMAPEAMNRNTLGHELGHIAQTKYVPNRAAADKYVDITLGTGGRGYYWLKTSPQGRAELATARPTMPRDQHGMPTLGPRGIHTAPLEQYANDFGASLGGDNERDLGQRTRDSLMRGQVGFHAPPDRIAKLRAAGLVAKKPYSGWIGPQGPRGPQSRRPRVPPQRDPFSAQAAMYLATRSSNDSGFGPMGPDNLLDRIDSLSDPRKQLGISQEQALRLFGLREDLDYKYGP